MELEEKKYCGLMHSLDGCLPASAFLMMYSTVYYCNPALLWDSTMWTEYAAKTDSGLQQTNDQTDKTLYKPLNKILCSDAF